ncbi:hypothetical protein LSTR_LSTR004358 [Laodelphax striatellus]|uniref:T-cell activation inhibitor, mitochondrial n=1 Tax=Laodelphax striatellus TaxID=195883 RepID=A0A482X965_LAOST|nr:hypothetical protein LSTR_LSTR004358 [Laodelphax striatellus]
MASEILCTRFGRLFQNDYASKYMFGVYRHLTSGEVLTALRPFYFTVHPDLFGQFPSERAINENSLQVLSSFLEGIQQNRYTRPTTVKFFLKPQKTVGQVTLKSVQINLVPQDVRKTVLTILASCNLPTTYVDKITPQPSPPPRKRDLDFREKVRKHYGDYEYKTHTRVKMEEIRKAKEDETLMEWLERGVAEAARAKTTANRPIVDEIERLREELIGRLGITEVLWDCGWNVAHFRGCLLSFKALVEQHDDIVKHLKGRRLVFGNDTGVTLDGQILLNRGEVRHNWLDFIKNVWKDDIVLQSVPAFEKAVSQVLRDIKVARRKFQPIKMAKQYEVNLRRLTTALIDYQGRRGYPKTWPESLNDFEIVVESEAGPLMVSPTGQFIVPSSCPSFLLVNFITDNMQQAADLLQQYKSHKYIEAELQRQCKAALKLADLRKDDNITPTLMIKCCDQLLARKEQLKPLLEGSYLYITNYYSVMSDGQICIPWNFRF